MAKQFDTSKIFTYHPPFGTQQERYVALRNSAKAHADMILAFTPPSREQSMALTDLQRSTQMANAAIAINEMNPITFVDAALPVLEGPGGSDVGQG